MLMREAQLHTQSDTVVAHNRHIKLRLFKLRLLFWISVSVAIASIVNFKYDFFLEELSIVLALISIIGIMCSGFISLLLLSKSLFVGNVNVFLESLLYGVMSIFPLAYIFIVIISMAEVRE